LDYSPGESWTIVLAKVGRQSWRKLDDSPGESWTTVLAKVGRQSWQKLDDSPGEAQLPPIIYAGLLQSK
jgi:hypothetical protein